MDLINDSSMKSERKKTVGRYCRVCVRRRAAVAALCRFGAPSVPEKNRHNLGMYIFHGPCGGHRLLARSIRVLGRGVLQLFPTYRKRTASSMESVSKDLKVDPGCAK